MGIAVHLAEALRQLHHAGGTAVALLGFVPALARRRGPRKASAGVCVGNLHFPADLSPARPLETEAARIIAGNPAQTASDLFVSADKRFSVGLWTCQPGKWRIDFGAHEFIHLLEGVVVVTDAGGAARTYRAGDSFVSPAGFSGTWDVIEPVTKHFVLYVE